MQRIIDFINKNKELFIYLSLLLISFSLITLGDINKVGGYRAFVVAVYGWFKSKLLPIPNIAGLKTENSTLREMNLQLSNKYINSRIAELENISLRRMLGMKERASFLYEIAEVVGSITIDLRNYIIINKGTEHGIESQMAVRTDCGLVGVVKSVSKNYSMVETILNYNVKVPAKILRNGLEGIVNYESDDKLYLKYVPKYSDVVVGDTLLTSHSSLKFPENIPIGVVVRKTEEEGELFSKVEVQSFVNFSLMEEVFVIKYLIDKELKELIEQTHNFLLLQNLPVPKELKLKIDTSKTNKSLRKVK